MLGARHTSKPSWVPSCARVYRRRRCFLSAQEGLAVNCVSHRVYSGPRCCMPRTDTRPSEKHRPDGLWAHHTPGPGHHRPVQLESAVPIQEEGRQAEQGAHSGADRCSIQPQRPPAPHSREHQGAPIRHTVVPGLRHCAECARQPRWVDSRVSRSCARD